MDSKQYHAELGKVIRNERIRHGMSQETLGKHLGVSFQQVQKYERGYNRICPHNLHLLSQLFGEELWQKVINIGRNPVEEIKSPRLTLIVFNEFQALSVRDQGMVAGIIRDLSKREAA